ncbi:MAG TPA: hypothetical protein VK666_21180, partial [Chryseolinea sp.]|nr:hypothetical protein [Chryseolinea sp.]
VMHRQTDARIVDNQQLWLMLMDPGASFSFTFKYFQPLHSIRFVSLQLIFTLDTFKVTKLMRKFHCCIALSAISFATIAQSRNSLHSKVDLQAASMESKVIAWRRAFHEHPELSNREFKTGETIAGILKSLIIA